MFATLALSLGATLMGVGLDSKKATKEKTRAPSNSVTVAESVKDSQNWIDIWFWNTAMTMGTSEAVVQKPVKAVTKITTKKTKKSVTKAVTKTSKKATKASTKKSKQAKRKSYYETINTVRYDGKVLDDCRFTIAIQGSIDLTEAKAIFKDIANGPVRKQKRLDGSVVKSSVTNVEIATAWYVLETFEWTEEAKEWFATKLLEIE